MKILLLVLLLLSVKLHAQLAYNSFPIDLAAVRNDAKFGNTELQFGRKLFQRNTGVILGIQRGRYTSFELGGEAHWRKISLLKPRVIGATANLEYNFADNVVGYKAGMWMKRGHINLTYGVNVGYFTDFKDRDQFAVGPSVGFRLFGFHFINGYNFFIKDKTDSVETALPANTLYMSLRYYIPVRNKFTWDRKTMKKKRERKRERANRKKEREKASSDGKSFWSFLKPNHKDSD